MTRYGPRLVLTSCLGLAALTTQLTYTLLATSLPSLCLGFALTGGLLAPCWPAVTSSLSASFPDKALNSVFGFANSATFAGGLAGTALASYLLEYSGWRSVGLPPALLTLLASLLVSLLLYSPAERGLKVPGKAPVQSETRDEEKTVESKSLLSLLRIPCVAEVSCAMFSLKFVRYCMAMWLPLYLLEELGYSKLQAGIFSTVFDVGGIIGAPVLGIALDRFASDRPLLGVSLLMVLGTVVTGLFALTASWGILFNSVFLLVAGAANSGPDSILAGSVSVRLGERSGAGLGGAVTSLINGVGQVGGVVEGPLIEVLAALVGWWGVLMALVLVSAVGSLATYRAFTVDQSERSSEGLLS